MFERSHAEQQAREIQRRIDRKNDALRDFAVALHEFRSPNIVDLYRKVAHGAGATYLDIERVEAQVVESVIL